MYKSWLDRASGAKSIDNRIQFYNLADLTIAVKRTEIAK